MPSFFLNLALAGLAAWGISWVYRKYGTSLSNRDGFSRNFVLLCMTTTVIISIVKSSLALSLGLVGALSIVRFRSAIKEPEELVYLFFCIAIGLGFGADQLWPTLGAIGMIVPVLIVRGVLAGRKETQDMLLIIASAKPTDLNLDSVLEILDKHCHTIQLKRLNEDDTHLEMSFSLGLNQARSIGLLTADLSTKYPTVHIQFLDQKMLPVA